MKSVIVIVAYRPKPAKEKEPLELVRNRVPVLRKEGLVTDRKPTIMRARDGTIIEESMRCLPDLNRSPTDFFGPTQLFSVRISARPCQSATDTTLCGHA